MKIFSSHKKFLLLIPIALFLFLYASVSIAAYKVEIGLPNLPTGSAVSDPGAYIRYLFIFGLSLAAFLAVAAIAWGGIQYMVAGASSMTSVQKAKELIIGALSGIVLLLCSWLILATIDPSLTNLTPTIPRAGNIAAPADIPPVSAPPPATGTLGWSCSNGGGSYASQADCTSHCAGGSCTEQSAAQ